MEPPSTSSSSESALLEVIAAELARGGQRPDLGDDCARLAGRTDLVTTDSLVEGVHFDLRRDSAEQVGAQAAVANLSDLAASGAGPYGLWLVWALCLPRSWGAERVAALTRGFVSVASAHGAQVMGGNLSRTPGPAVVAVTAGGPLAGSRALTRDGARPGDAVYVTGFLGDSALGLVNPAARAARHGWRPHLAEAAALARWGHVTAMMDVSDGLLLDASRVAAASGVGVQLESARVPLSPLYRALRGEPDLALRGGEDYVLLFTAPPQHPPPAPSWRIGACTAAPGLWLDGAPAAAAGFDHFSQ